MQYFLAFPAEPSGGADRWHLASVERGPGGAECSTDRPELLRADAHQSRLVLERERQGVPRGRGPDPTGRVTHPGPEARGLHQQSRSRHQVLRVWQLQRDLPILGVVVGRFSERFPWCPSPQQLFESRVFLHI